MNTVIFRTVAPILAALMLMYSVFVLLRGHNAPGGGFIGGLIATAALAIYGIAMGPAAVRRAIALDPLALSGIGLALAALAGFASLPLGAPILTGQWIFPFEIPLSTVLVFDVGVYLVVVGSLSSVALTLEEG